MIRTRRPLLRLGRMAPSLLVLASLGACRSRHDRPLLPLPEPPAASASATVTQAASSDIETAGASQRPGPPWSRPHTSTLPPWPSGPGAVCGEVRCGAAELCCLGEQPRCLPVAREKECLDAAGIAMGCDESSDCPAGQICCLGVIYQKQATRISCQTPSVCAIPLSAPGSFPIPGGELCARGGSCRDPKLLCVDDEQAPSGGRCISNVGSVVCRDGKRCPADRPWCHWDPHNRVAECIPRGPWDHEEGVNVCDGPEDCVGEPCCTHGPKSFCTMDCDESFRFAELVCHTDADCPRSTRNQTQRVVWHCVGAREEALPGLKVCEQTVINLP